MEITRRGLIGAAACGLPAVMTTGFAPAVAQVPATPFVPDMARLWEWMLFMNSLGPRRTGNAAHVRFVEFLAERIAAIPGLVLTRDRYELPLWEATGTALSTGAGQTQTPLRVASYYPYSGQTPAAGVSGPIAYLGATSRAEGDPLRATGFDNVGDLTGKIVLLDAPVHGFDYANTTRSWGVYRSDTEIPSLSRDAVWQSRSAPGLGTFRDAGAIGVVLAWQGLSDGAIEGQYVSFGRPLQNIPCLWVGESAGARLKAAAARGETATLTLPADVTPSVPTETLVATLPGATDEVVLVNTHTDGPNALEENGGLGLLMLARHLAELGPRALRRTYVFVFASGHMAGYVRSIHAFIHDHPDIIGRTVAALSVEHLGATDWGDTAEGAYVPLGRNRLSTVFTRQRKLAKLVLETVSGTVDDRVAVLDPFLNRSSGEGAAFLPLGIPTINYIPAPAYLLAETASGSIEKIDPRLMAGQITNLASILRRLDVMSRADLSAR